MVKKPQALTLEYQELDDGRCRAILVADGGSVLVDRIYKNKNSAQASVRTRLVKEGLGSAPVRRIYPDDEQESEVASDDPGPAEVVDNLEFSEALVPLPPDAFLRETAPGVSTAQDLLLQLRAAAEGALNAVLALRAQADALEVDYKRLAAAADVLEGPEA